MFFDTVNNNYTYFDSLKRIVWECPNTQHKHPDLCVTLRPSLSKLFARLMRERPTWRFKATQKVWGGTARLEVNNFDIYDGDEEIGTVWTEREWRDSTDRIYFKNPRVAASRMRRGDAYSTKVDVAAKRILKSFYAKTLAERASIAFGAAREAISPVHGAAYGGIVRTRSAVERQAYAKAMEDWDAMVALCGPDMAALDLPSVQARWLEAEALYQTLSTHTGTVIQRNPDGTYLLARPYPQGGYEAHNCTDATLPSYVIGALGLLKLVEPGTFIPGMGVRAKQGDVFFIMVQPEEEPNG